MYLYLATGALANSIKPVLDKHGLAFDLAQHPDIREPMIYSFESPVTPEEMLPYMEEANLIARIVPVRTDDIQNRCVRTKIMMNMAHLAYLSETDRLIISSEDEM